MSTYMDAYQEAETAIGGPELEYLHLGYRLQADAQYISGLITRGREQEARNYVRDTHYVQRRNAWRNAQ